MRNVKMDSERFIEESKDAIVNYYVSAGLLVDGEYKEYFKKCICLVWFSKTIQNFKGLFFVPEAQRYVEVTFNGDKNELYVDFYQKIDKIVYQMNFNEE